MHTHNSKLLFVPTLPSDAQLFLRQAFLHDLCLLPRRPSYVAAPHGPAALITLACLPSNESLTMPLYFTTLAPPCPLSVPHPQVLPMSTQLRVSILRRPARRFFTAAPGRVLPPSRVIFMLVRPFLPCLPWPSVHGDPRSHRACELGSDQPGHYQGHVAYTHWAQAAAAKPAAAS